MWELFGLKPHFDSCLKVINYNDVVRVRFSHSSSAVPITVFCPNVPTLYDQIYNAIRKRTCYH